MRWLFTPFFNLLSTSTKVLTTLIYISFFFINIKCPFMRNNLAYKPDLVLLNRVRFWCKSKLPVYFDRI
ncbi:hypothetical protein EDF73_101636 [Raoultella sp. BIGb0138]|nr:hypothetical protein EDF73_101636 [Raoultella sp. BIGb0138]